MIEMDLELKNEELEKDRKNLRIHKVEMNNVFHGNYDELHSEFIDRFCTKYKKELNFIEDAVIREVFTFLKSKE